MREVAVAEPVRLVIWDLDETFWKGTLTEGGIEYQQDIHDLVVYLAQRGIISRICSNANQNQVKPILVEHGLWDYFVFPSINWEPKGKRIESMIGLAQLRPESCLFIDDNLGNLNEAKHYVPGLQIADETIIPEIRNHPLFAGKDDSALTRLRHYQVLEGRNGAALAHGGDSTAFLRSSGIRVEIEYDVERHLDRAIEIINRTNQLNFTKRRLPEDIVAARTILRERIKAYNAHTRLIRVSDRYGDYGICGFYFMERGIRSGSLLDYCFSCRILNMGVESWLFYKLGYPWLVASADAAPARFDDGASIDWIMLGCSERVAAPEVAPAPAQIILHGGCELAFISDYFRQEVGEMISEHNTVRDGIEIRMDHSALLRLAIEPPDAPTMAALGRVGYLPAHFETQIDQVFQTAPLVILSFVIDGLVGVYRHKSLGFRIPVALPINYSRGPVETDATKLERSALGEAFQSHWVADVMDELRDNYVHEGMISEQAFKANLMHILRSIQVGANVVILCGNEDSRDVPRGSRYQLTGVACVNRWIGDVATQYPGVTTVNMRQFVLDEAEVDDNPSHFSRMVYYRLFQHLRDRTMASVPKPRALAVAALLTEPLG